MFYNGLARTMLAVCGCVKALIIFSYLATKPLKL